MWRRLLAVLDGKPRTVKGQSLVEMTVTFPILILMVLGMSELGFAANNFLTLMDLAREAGRRGSVMSAPLWNGAKDTRNYNRMDCDDRADYFNIFPRQERRVPRGKTVLDGYGYTVGEEGEFNFFDSVVCQAAYSFEPLEFEDLSKWEDAGMTAPPRNAPLFSKNDIVVSAVSYTRMNYNDTASLKPPGGDVGLGLPASRVWITVTGRWPMENRFCNDGGGNGDSRDPFDFKRIENYSLWSNAPSSTDPGELPGTIGTPAGLLGPGNSQGIRGFVFTGASRDERDGCLGSRFNVQDIESRLNEQFTWLPEIAAKVRSGGMVIVEIYWQHHPAIFGVLFQGNTGDTLNDPLMYVYGIFPSTGSEPTATPEN